VTSREGFAFMSVSKSNDPSTCRIKVLLRLLTWFIGTSPRVQLSANSLSRLANPNPNPNPNAVNILLFFYQRVSIASYASAGIARGGMSVCPFVRPSHSSIVSKRRKLAS